jgi:hypothetical protein
MMQLIYFNNFSTFQIKFTIAAPVGGDITRKVLIYNDDYNKEHAENCVYSILSTTFPFLYSE